MLQAKSTFKTEADYHSFHPAPNLRSFIKEYWVLNLNAKAAHHKGELEQPKIYPEVIFKFGVDYEEFRLNTKTKEVFLSSNITGVSNYAKASKRVNIEENLLLIGVKFMPLGMYALLEMPLIELYNQCIPIDVLSIPFLKELEEKLSNKNNAVEQLATLNNEFTKVFDKQSIASDCLKFYDTMAGLKFSKLDELMKSNQFHYKYLERSFRKYLGINPKKMMKLLRYQAFYNDWLSASQYKYIDLVYKYDYYDQNHLIKDFKKVLNTSPSKFLKMMNKEFTQHITKANLANYYTLI